MSGRLSRFAEMAAAATVGNWLDRLLRRFWRPVALVLAAPVVWLWSRVVLATGDVRAGTLVTLLLLAGLVALVVWARQVGTAWWLDRQRADRPSATAGGPDPECLYRWHEPTDLPYGSVCACGKPRLPGELAYVGISWDVQRRNKAEDRRSACWWHVGLVGTVETYATRAAVEAAERQAIDTESPRENIAHAGRR